MRSHSRNSFRISVERNQAGRCLARIEARFAEPEWVLRVYLVVSAPERVPAQLERALRYLQAEEEQLWLWGSNSSDRSLLLDELLASVNLKLDRRQDPVRPSVVISARAGEGFRPLALAELRRKLGSLLAPPARVAPRRATALRSSA